jgi:MOSC domain-containing protein YiiM
MSALVPDLTDPAPHVTSVNVGPVREVAWRGDVVRTGIWKSPVGSAPVLVHGVNLDGDDQADRRVHGGPDKAVYAYAEEDYAWWREAHGIATEPGLFGENLTVRGLDLGAAVVGERWRVGDALLEVAQPRLPCFKLGIRMGDPFFPKRFQAAGRLGAYLRIVASGHVRAGDVVQVAARPAHDVTLRVMAAAMGDAGLAARVLAVPAVPASWRRMLGG